MKYGIFLPPFDEMSDPRRAAALAVDAEQAGWDGLFVWDHMLAEPGMAVADPWIVMAAIAASTTRLRTGPMVTPLAQRRPWVLARQIATLDVLSGGRLTVGVGLGDDGWREFSSFGDETSPKVRGEMLDEALQIVQGLLAGDTVEFKGEHFAVSTTPFLPRPVQDPVPIWAAVRWPNRKPLARAARLPGCFPIFAGSGQLPAPPRTEDLVELRAALGDLGAAPGHDVAVRVALHRLPEPARPEAAARLAAQAGVTWLLEAFEPGHDAAQIEAWVGQARLLLHTRRVTTPDPRDPLGLRADAPMLAAWLDFTARAEAGELLPMSTPGHKQRQDLVGAVVAGDAPFYGGLDTIKHADHLRVESEQRAAGLWGADWCRFSVAGSTHGNQALALAVGAPGQKVIINRTLHRSLLLGLVLAGLHPVWVRPDIDAGSGLPAGVAVGTVRDALAAHPDACAVFLGDPTYVGTIGDIAGQAEVAHAAGVPLIVDAAWAAHLGFHPDLPRHAIAAGADAMVTSAHKALPAYTQGALVLARTERLDTARLDRAFEATHTTSPTGSILASIDAARALLAREGERLCGRLIAGVAAARKRLAEVPGLAALDGPGVEPGKLTALLAGTGAHGNLVEADLIAAGMPVEMGDRDTIIAITTIADDEAKIATFTETLIAAVEKHRGQPRHPEPAAAWTVQPQTVLSPREAFFAPNETVPAAAAIGRVSAELIAPYPPGVPVLAPGELITAEAVNALLEVQADGGRIAYAADPSLATFQVITG